jgi:hypothetical protein
MLPCDEVIYEVVKHVAIIKILQQLLLRCVGRYLLQGKTVIVPLPMPEK